ncbi:M23 family metallopeptidase [Nocardia blacklockiae]|uniref:M23 family metallopeptidase n=1 Tax=Nocardia blacklockiae TaxID=480036 RepID=UPI001894B0C3|nr:M23 family metallopeptidase [Nocardia blacklockiae]MBF6170581.1 M23 family metallopeptidase [Nocardia blacklockiae]
MPVTVPLSSRRARRAARAVALTAVVGASVGTFTAVEGRGDSSAAGLAAVRQSLPAVATVESPVSATAAAVAEPPEAVPPMPVEWAMAKAAKDTRPTTVRPVAGALSSVFGLRWGALHGGIDFADALGAPIASVTDGVVIEAGPASGFGMWVRVRQDDGTVGVYGHVNDVLVGVGQQVRAGDVIATVGNRGYSTGPHLHYEVWAGEGGEKMDPVPWLVGRGIEVGGVRD